MKTTSPLIALTFALSLSIAPAAPTEGAPKKKADPEKVFKRKDANNDSTLTKDEFVKGEKDAAKGEKIFSKKDKNSDGKLTLEEYKTAAKRKKATE